MAKLILKFEEAVLKEIPLQRAPLVVGRSPGNDVVIDNLAVSGHHAKISLDQDHYVIEDMSSLNGTFVNNQRIRRSQLKDGDEILIGKHTLVYQDEGGVAVPPAAEKTQQIPAVPRPPRTGWRRQSAGARPNRLRCRIEAAGCARRTPTHRR